jgi:hypothetical protein
MRGQTNLVRRANPHKIGPALATALPNDFAFPASTSDFQKTSLTPTPNHLLIAGIPPHREGRIAIVMKRWAGMRWTSGADGVYPEPSKIADYWRLEHCFKPNIARPRAS